MEEAEIQIIWCCMSSCIYYSHLLNWTMFMNQKEIIAPWLRLKLMGMTCLVLVGITPLQKVTMMALSLIRSISLRKTHYVSHIISRWTYPRN